MSTFFGVFFYLAYAVGFPITLCTPSGVGAPEDNVANMSHILFSCLVEKPRPKKLRHGKTTRNGMER